MFAAAREKTWRRVLRRAAAHHSTQPNSTQVPSESPRAPTWYTSRGGCSLDALVPEVISGAAGHVIIHNISALGRAQVAGPHEPACALGLIALLLAQPEVLVVEPVRQPKLHDAFARTITESGSGSGFRQITDLPVSTTLGLDGSGEIIGIVDTGVDDMSCFFTHTS